MEQKNEDKIEEKLKAEIEKLKAKLKQANEEIKTLKKFIGG